MKLLVSIFLTSVSVSTFADVSIEKAKNFMKKKDFCSFAVGTKNPMRSKSNDLMSQTYCVGDFAKNKGTANETAGCGFVLYNIESGAIKYTGGYPTYPEMVIVSKKCSDGGFEQLMKKQGSIMMGSVGNIMSGKSIPGGTIFIYSSDEKYEQWFNQNKKKN